MSISWISFEALSPISRSWNPQQVRHFDAVIGGIWQGAGRAS